jgi:hypothetical protein
MLQIETIYINSRDVRQIDKTEAAALKKGAVILVRSNYKYDKYLDHASLIVGGLIKKERGVRPNLITLPQVVGNIATLLNMYDPIDGAIILLVSDEASKKIMDALGMHLSEGELITNLSEY